MKICLIEYLATWKRMEHVVLTSSAIAVLVGLAGSFYNFRSNIDTQDRPGSICSDEELDHLEYAISVCTRANVQQCLEASVPQEEIVDNIDCFNERTEQLKFYQNLYWKILKVGSILGAIYNAMKKHRQKNDKLK